MILSRTTNSLDSAFMQNSTMSLPNRSHSVTEMGTLNGDPHHHRSGLRHSNSTANNSLLYQRSLSYVKTMNEYNVEPTHNNDRSFRAEKYNLVCNDTPSDFFPNTFLLL